MPNRDQGAGVDTYVEGEHQAAGVMATAGEPEAGVEMEATMATEELEHGQRPRMALPPRTRHYEAGPQRAPGWHRLYRISPVARFFARHFHRTFYYAMRQTILETSWLGVPVLKSPLDLWVYQELITELRPGLIVEAGTYRGGSALFFAQLTELLDCGRVVTIDPVPAAVPEHDRITYIIGSSVASDTLEQVRELVDPRRPVVVVLDSDHSRDHVLEELRCYADLVTPGSYLIAEDTNINGHPVLPQAGPGPLEAVQAFLAEDDRFAVDRSREKFLLTMHPGGFLKRVR